MRNTLTILILIVATTISHAQTALSLFDTSKMEYKGSKTEQAELLLRTVKIGGNIENKKPEIDKRFLTLLNSNVDIAKSSLKKYLTENEIKENEIGGKIDDPVSFITLNGNKVYAKYFVIHDVSTPEYKDSQGFPNDINNNTWKFNNISIWTNKYTHTYITRTGGLKNVVSFSEGLPEDLWGTKFERKNLGISSKGLFIHIELVQPRKFPPGNKGYAKIAPTPGFTDVQYEKLALLYICVSTRKGEWLIPAFHGCIDEGIKNGHDDPQNFELKKFTDKVLELTNLIQKL